MTHLGARKAHTVLGSGLAQEPPLDSVYDDAISAAAYVGDISFVRALLKLRVNVDAKSACFGRPLQASSKQWHKYIVRLLLEHGAAINDPGGADGTALEVASMAGHGQVVRLLLESKYGINTSDVAYERAIIKAACGGHRLLVQLLMEHGRVDHLSDFHSKILREAAYHGHGSIVTMMLEEGVDANDEDRRHQVALLKAASRRLRERCWLASDRGSRLR